MSDKTKIQWISDSGGITSCHLNAPSLKHSDSYIGHVTLKDGQWYSKLKGEDKLRGPHKNFYAAKLDVEASVNGEPV